jgi:hypothetical protein
MVFVEDGLLFRPHLPCSITDLQVSAKNCGETESKIDLESRSFHLWSSVTCA